MNHVKEQLMSEAAIILTFAGGLCAALVFGYLALRLNISPIVGYLLAGIAVGPFTPGFTAHQHIAEQFAEIGVILLLFGIGLRFHLRELIAIWHVAVPGALIQSILSTAAAAVILHFNGWSWQSGIVLGLAVSVASTVVMALVLASKHDLHAPIGHLAIGWTVVEDILTVLYILLLPIIFAKSGGSSSGIAAAVGLTALKIAGLVLSVIVLGKWIIPRILDRVALTRSRELFTLTILVMAIGIAVGSAGIFGVSMALGAFLAGLAIGRSEFAARAGNDVLPMRDAFAVLFFVSVGMLFNPVSLIEHPLLILSVTGVVLVCKPLATLLTVRLLGKPMKIAFPVGAALSQIGEFSFILGTLARGMGLIGDAGWNAIIASSIISIILNPSIYALSRRISSAAAGKSAMSEPAAEKEIDHRTCILVGFGPVGRTVYRILTQSGTVITVIELNLDTVRALKKEGINAVYGDILRPGTLEDAGISEAGSLILSADIEDASEIVRHARAINPRIRILARCSHLSHAEQLKKAGADIVAAGEAEVAAALAEEVMLKTEDPVERLRQRDAIRNRLYSEG